MVLKANHVSAVSQCGVCVGGGGYIHLQPETSSALWTTERGFDCHMVSSPNLLPQVFNWVLRFSSCI